MQKKCLLERLIQRLQDLETRKYRGCNLCVHVAEPQEIHPTSGDLKLIILSPCLACDRNHDCFQLDYEKLAEEVELGLMTKGEAKHVQEQYTKNLS